MDRERKKEKIFVKYINNMQRIKHLRLWSKCMMLEIQIGEDKKKDFVISGLHNSR